IGRNKKPFILVKFRTMSKDTASVASHLASSTSITKPGRFLRRTKLDELPQLWNVLKGEMSLVGPRPGLPNQELLTEARSRLNVYSVSPGITGLAQIKGIDMSTPELLARTDAQMIAEMSVTNYFRFIFLTVIGNGKGDRIKQK
ncbi:MAG: sugar transferase, partial [Paracoccaceae bacterium]